MKRIIALILAIVSISSCLILTSCAESHDQWHQRQVQKGMNEAKKKLGR